MRTFLILVSVFQFVFGGVMLGSSAEQLREIKLIRRAYLDVAGVVPITEEIEWFVVYNDKGYELAVDYLFDTYNTKLIKEYLLSDAYKNQQDRLLSREELDQMVMYAVGTKGKAVTGKEIHAAKQKLVELALKCSDGTDDAIDYICNALMSRSSNVSENNMLSRKFRDACAVGNENIAWMLIVEEILKLPDVCHK